MIAPGASGANRMALVVGINDYPEGSKFGDLQNCVNDAKLIAKVLDQLDFEVITAFDVTKVEFDNALQSLTRNIDPGGTALIYFAGHGLQYKQQNYLMMSNAMLDKRSELPYEAVRVETCTNAMTHNRAKFSFLFLDCCREVPHDFEWETRGIEVQGLADFDTSGDIVISMAAAPGKAAMDGGSAGNSPYAAALAKWMRSGEDHMTMFQRVRKEVHVQTDGFQRTWEKSSLLERFYFSKKETTISPQPAGGGGGGGSMGPQKPSLPQLLPGTEREFGGLKMVWCPPGTFKMGSPISEIGRSTDETGQSVKITTGFWLGKQEVTKQDWERLFPGRNQRDLCKKAIDSDETYRWDDGTVRTFRDRFGFQKFSWADVDRAVGPKNSDTPMYFVNWYDAMEYCNKLNELQRGHLPRGWAFSLPTEAQWEYACRAQTFQGTYAGDLRVSGDLRCNTLDTIGWYRQNSGDGYTGPGWTVGTITAGPRGAGKKLPNNWGLYDMNGNVREWTRDWYGNYIRRPVTNPLGASQGAGRVMRGGSWRDPAPLCRSASRQTVDPSLRTNYTGFRVALTNIKPPSTDSKQSAPVSVTQPTPQPVAPRPSGGMMGSTPGEVREFGGMIFAWCPPGSFMMGSPPSEEGRDPEERQHTVSLSRGFWLGKYECTQAQYVAVSGRNPSSNGGPTHGDHPVEKVSWEDAVKFCSRMNSAVRLDSRWHFTLPTEAQWEYACRAGTFSAFSFGPQLRRGQAAFDRRPTNTVKTGSYSPNSWGLHDMHGNVREWCIDWYEPYKGNVRRDPMGRGSRTYHVIRGGGWNDHAYHCRSAYRSKNNDIYNYVNLGFRVAVVPKY